MQRPTPNGNPAFFFGLCVRIAAACCCCSIGGCVRPTSTRSDGCSCLTRSSRAPGCCFFLLRGAIGGGAAHVPGRADAPINTSSCFYRRLTAAAMTLAATIARACRMPMPAGSIVSGKRGELLITLFVRCRADSESGRARPRAFARVGVAARAPLFGGGEAGGGGFGGAVGGGVFGGPGGSSAGVGNHCRRSSRARARRRGRPLPDAPGARRAAAPVTVMGTERL